MSPSLAALLAGALAAAAAAAPLSAAEAAMSPVPRPVPTLSVTADATVEARPDVAHVFAGVVTQAPEAAAALAANSARMGEVIDALKRGGVPDRDIQTRQLSLLPQYRNREGQAPLITGYQAMNGVSVRLRDLGRIGPVLDTLVRVGANSIDGPRFAIDRPEPLLDQARVQAVKAARARADLLAAAAGVSVVRVLSIREGAAFDIEPSPVMRAMVMDAAATASPVEPGETRLTATVTVTFEVR